MMKNSEREIIIGSNTIFIRENILYFTPGVINKGDSPKIITALESFAKKLKRPFAMIFDMSQLLEMEILPPVEDIDGIKKSEESLVQLGRVLSVWIMPDFSSSLSQTLIMVKEKISPPNETSRIVKTIEDAEAIVAKYMESI